MSEYILTLIIIGLGATFILTVLFIWHAFLWRSWGRVIGMFTRLWVDSTDIVDIDKKIVPNMRATHADIMKAQAEALEAVPLAPVPLEPPKAHIPLEEQSQYERTTSESGWPRKLSEEERHDSRPFRNVHIGTENESLAMQPSPSENPSNE